MLGLLHPLDRRLDGVDPGLDPARGDHLPRRLGLRPQSLPAALLEGAADEGRLRVAARSVVHARRRRVGGDDQIGRQDAARGEDGRARRRPPGHRRVHLVQGARGAQGARARGRRATTCRSTRPTGPRSSTRTRTTRCASRDAFMEAVVEGKEWNLTARTDGSVIETVDARELLRDIAAAAWECADPGVQYDTTINSWHTLPNTGRINASNPCSEYMSIDDSACNLASLNLMKFRKEDGELDVEAFEHAVDVDLPRAGDRRRLLVLPDARDRAQRDRLPPARARLREPRRAADGARPALRLRRGPGLRGRDHGADDGPRRTASRPRWRSGWARSPGTQPNAAAMIGVIAKHRAAVGNINHSDSVPDDLLEAARRGVGRRARSRRGGGLPQRAGDGARADRDDQLHDGLRHDRRGARLLAGEVEEARRRRRDHDRQQDGADGARRSSAMRRARPRRSSRSSTSATRSSARRT